MPKGRAKRVARLAVWMDSQRGESMAKRRDRFRQNGAAIGKAENLAEFSKV